jgi:sugar/nucleoside kinase (ribokinase family)
MADLSQQRSGVLAGGNWIVDHVKMIDRWPPQDALANIRGQESSNGGSPYNLLKNLSRMGATFPLEAIGLVGDDEGGHFIREDCARHRIDTSHLLATIKAPTSYTDVMTEQGSGRRTFFHCRGANAELAPEHFDFSRSRARMFHLGYLLLLDRLDGPGAAGTAGADVLRAARAVGMLTSADLVSEISPRVASVVRPALPHLDHLFLNELELTQLTGVETARAGRVDRRAVAEAASSLLRDGVRQWVFVHFPAAVLACGRGGEQVWQPSVNLPPDFIKGAAGAGDACATGILYGVHEGWPVLRSLELGVCAAAASLDHPTCSEGVRPLQDCLALGRRFGFRPLE